VRRGEASSDILFGAVREVIFSKQIKIKTFRTKVMQTRSTRSFPRHAFLIPYHERRL